MYYKLKRYVVFLKFFTFILLSRPFGWEIVQFVFNVSIPILKALANENTLLRTHCCRNINVSLFACARNICCGHKFCVRDTKMLLILFRNILCPQQMFPSLRSPGNIMGNNVSATMCPCLLGPLKSY